MLRLYERVLTNKLINSGNCLFPELFFSEILNKNFHKLLY
ncbi:hypothetical protein IMSAG049_00174 [Clostridiales bacterium]|nr:hypothetical protein IMSAG049_00174 [Clostridiales bacterium]